MPIPLSSSLIHGIYDEDVKEEQTFRQHAQNLSQFLEGSDLAGYNCIKFDIPVLMEEFLRVGIEFDFEGRDRKSVVSGKSVSVRVDLGGRRSITKKKAKRKEKSE